MDPYRRVEVVDPDPAWPGAFAAEAGRIRAALGPAYVAKDDFIKAVERRGIAWSRVLEGR